MKTKFLLFFLLTSFTLFSEESICISKRDLSRLKGYCESLEYEYTPYTAEPLCIMWKILRHVDPDSCDPKLAYVYRLYKEANETLGFWRKNEPTLKTYRAAMALWEYGMFEKNLKNNPGYTQ